MLKYIFFSTPKILLWEKRSKRETVSNLGFPYKTTQYVILPLIVLTFNRRTWQTIMNSVVNIFSGI